MAKLATGAIAASLLVAAVVTVESLLQTPKYEASALVRVDFQKRSDKQTNQTGSGEEFQTLPLPSEGRRQLIRMMVTTIDARPVAQRAVRRLGLRMSAEELLNNLTVEQVQASPFIRLSYTDTDAKRARQVVSTLAEVASEDRIELGSREAGATLRATVYEKARVPHAPTSPKPLRNGLLALVVALALSAALVAGYEFLRRS
jgi:capsular polysaccharide biosynthesis protein